MLDYQREILEKRLPFLLEHLVLDSEFFAHIISTRLLSEGCIEDIQARSTERNQIFRLVELLKKRPPSCFSEFLKILKLTQQHHIYKELNSMRHQKIKHLPKSPEIEKNVKKTLHSDLVPGRLLSTVDKDVLCQKFVLRADYDEINEDKHILQQDKEKLQKEVEEERERVEYETRHHQFVKDELDNERAKKKRLEQECTELKEQLARLKRKIEALQNDRRQAEETLNQQKQEIADLSKTLENYRNIQKTVKEDTDDGTTCPDSEVTTPGNLEDIKEGRVCTDHQMSTRLEHITILCEEAQSTNGEVADCVNDSNDVVTELQREMVDLTKGLSDVHKEMTDGKCEFSDTGLADVTINDVTMNPANNDTHRHEHSHPSVVKSHRRHNRHVRHVRETNRVINLETELSVLKSKLKRVEDMLEEQSTTIKQKDKQLKEEEHKIIQLRQHLRLQKESNAQPKAEHTGIMVPHPPNYTNTTTPDDRGYSIQRSFMRKLSSGNVLLKNRQNSVTERTGCCHKSNPLPTITTVSYEPMDLMAEKSLSIPTSTHQSIISLDMGTSCLTTQPKTKSGYRN